MSTVDADGRTVRTVVIASSPPDPDSFDVILSGDRLDVPGHDRLAPSGVADSSPLALPGTETLAVDPATPGPYPVTNSDYQLTPVPIPRMREPIEMMGHVVEPTAEAVTGPRPLVLFLHGRHPSCYRSDEPDAWAKKWPCRAPFKEVPSHLGYDYLQRLLASQGYTTVSIRANGINAQDHALADGGAGARAKIVARHLDHWAGLASSGQVDLSRVVLVGHSRGGEGVDRAAIQIPLDAPYQIVGQVLLAPTDFAHHTAPYVPTVTILPACDGDVSDLQGQRFTDTARDLTSDDGSLKSTVLVMGANHNYFNTEWTPATSVAPSEDDWLGDRNGTCGTRDPQRLRPAGQRAVALGLVAGAVHLFAAGEQSVLPLFDGSRARVASQGGAQTLSHAIGGGRELRVPRLDTDLTLPVGARTRFCRGESSPGRVSSCAYGLSYGNIRPSWPDSTEHAPSRPFFQMSWTAPNQSGGLVLDQPLDLTGRRLEMRTIVEPKRSGVDLRVRLTDTQGRGALFTPVGGGTFPGLGDSPETKNLWAQSLVVDPTVASDLDLDQIAQVELVSASSTGRVWIADLASAPSELEPVRAHRLPVLRLSSLRVKEGHGPGGRTALVPFTVTGELAAAARVAILTRGQERGHTQRFMLDLAPGQTKGSIPISYSPDRRDDLDKTVTEIRAFPVSGVITDRYVGDLTVLDDDPRPRITVRPLHKQVIEGQTARWRVTLARPVDYDFYLRGKVLPSVRFSAAPAVRGEDVVRSWIEMSGGLDLRRPLWAIDPYLGENLPRGGRSVDFAIPIRRDGLQEPAESLALRLRGPGFRSTSVVKVVD